MKDYKLYKNDSINVMRILPDKSVDITVTSPPYNMNLRTVSKGDTVQYRSRQIVKELSTKYEGFNDNLDMEEYYNFLCKYTTEMIRVSKLVFLNIQVVTGNKQAIFKFIGNFHKQIKEIIIWDKINSQPAMQIGVLNSQFEIILVMTDFKPELRSFQKPVFGRGSLTNLWSIKREKSVSKKHGAVFPRELVFKILENFTTEGDIVLDPFMGTGTTGECCLRTNRKFVGVELLETYFDIAAKRIARFR